MDEDIKQLLGEVIQHVDDKAVETQNRFDEKVAEITKHVDDKAVETQRHFDVVAENLKHEIQLVAEGVSVNTRQINAMQQDITSVKGKVEEIDVRLINVKDKVEGLESKVDNLEKDMKIVKTDVAFIKSELYQKVSREEFAFLENRVAALENKNSH